MIIKYIIQYNDNIVIKNNIEDLTKYLIENFINIPSDLINKLEIDGYYKKDNLIINESYLNYKCCGQFITNRNDLKEHLITSLHITYLEYKRCSNKKRKRQVIKKINTIVKNNISFKVCFD
jgi:hypothetical protein